MLKIKTFYAPQTWKLSSDKKVSGFTLIELLVAIVITGMMLTLVLASYWTFLQTQQKMAISRELQSEVRFVFNRFADKVRSSTINYAEYAPGGECEITGTRLCLISPSRTGVFFDYDSANTLLNLGIRPSYNIGDPVPAIEYEPLISPNKFTVTGLNFDFSPTDDPAVLANDQLQPKATFYLEVSPRDGRYQDLVIESQTTVSSRQY